MDKIFLIINLALNIAMYIIFIQVIMSWLINFGVLNLHQPIVYQLWQGINRLLNPVYSRIRQFLPNTGGLDFAPLIALFSILALQILIS